MARVTSGPQSDPGQGEGRGRAGGGQRAGEGRESRAGLLPVLVVGGLVLAQAGAGAVLVVTRLLLPCDGRGRRGREGGSVARGEWPETHRPSRC